MAKIINYEAFLGQSSFLCPPVTPSLLDPNIPVSALVSSTLNLRPSVPMEIVILMGIGPYSGMVICACC
jgi:hypothetical protein